VLGPEHPDTYAAIESVAHVLTSQGDADALHNWYVCGQRLTSRFAHCRILTGLSFPPRSSDACSRYLEHPVCAPDHLVALPLSSAHEWLDNEPGTLDRQGSDVSGGSNRAGSREGKSLSITHGIWIAVVVVLMLLPRNATLIVPFLFPHINIVLGNRPSSAGLQNASPLVESLQLILESVKTAPARPSIVKPVSGRNRFQSEPEISMVYPTPNATPQQTPRPSTKDSPLSKSAGSPRDSHHHDASAVHTAAGSASVKVMRLESIKET